MNQFRIAYPVKPNTVTQNFGEIANLEYYKANGINFTGHNGIDYLAMHGQPVYAAHDGIAYPEEDDKQGFGVVIVTLESYLYKEISSVHFKTIYWHLIDNIPVKWGQAVKKGDIIGYADSTGLSTGDHLHFGLKAMYGPNPLESGNVDQGNGYMGAIDPSTFFDGTYAADTQSIVGKEAPFTTNLEFGQKNDEVKRLQKVLKQLGYFTYADCTGFYGNETAKAVLAFQWKMGVINTFQYLFYKGRYFYEKTRLALNKII